MRYEFVRSEWRQPKVVSATDEDDAIRKVQEELAKPYGFFGRWETKALEVEVVGGGSRLGEAPAAFRRTDRYFSG